ncbi:alpha/beta hydrolase [Amycolatopsis sp. WGS_07]|uniref:alpha/beta hydrolase n=1 Tax=Amycolatopsis sp. WGS_07 TaxID=3076764 RepID=UPI0038735FF0
MPSSSISSASIRAAFTRASRASVAGTADLKPGLPKTLVVSTTHDPATPYRQGVALAKGLNAALLTVDDVQHAAVLKGNGCVDKATTAYRITAAARDGRC